VGGYADANVKHWDTEFDRQITMLIRHDSSATGNFLWAITLPNVKSAFERSFDLGDFASAETEIANFLVGQGLVSTART